MRFIGFCAIVMALPACAQSATPLPPEMAGKSAGVLVSPVPANPDHTNSKNGTGVPALSAVPQLPAGKVALLGGTITRVDHVLDRLTLQVFGGSAATVLFDERTRVFRNGQPGSTDDFKEGMRAYVDTMLDGTSVFARNVRLVAAPTAGESSGLILEIDAATRKLSVRDGLSPEPLSMQLVPNAAIFRDDQRIPPSDLRAGDLVTLTFLPESAGLPQVTRVSILATPGTQYTFAGHVEYLDLHRGLMVVVDPRDKKSYEVNFDSSNPTLARDLAEGANVTVRAAFDGLHYQAQSITTSPSIGK